MTSRRPGDSWGGIVGAVVVLAIWEKRGGSVEWINLLPNDI